MESLYIIQLSAPNNRTRSEWEYGDGDQSRLVHGTLNGQVINYLYHVGADLTTLMNQHRISLWSKSCESGDLPTIKELLSEEPWHLDQRESLLRYRVDSMAFLNIWQLLVIVNRGPKWST